MMKFVSEVYLNVLFKVVIASLVLPLVIELYKPAGFGGFVISCAVSMVSVALCVYLWGLSADERSWIKNLIGIGRKEK